MDFCAGGELYERIYRFGPYPEDTAGGIIRVVVTAVKYLHDNGVVHRDLKAENILFRGPDTNDPNNIVIADFGLARLFQNNETSPLKTVCGTPGWMAPEVLTAKSIYGREVDLWAIGVLAYFILSGLMPFESDNHLEETINVTVGRYQFGHGFEHVSAIGRSCGVVLYCRSLNPVPRFSKELYKDAFDCHSCSANDVGASPSTSISECSGSAAFAATLS